MKKKGFTLIEVLAILVVIAIISMIIVPNISSYIKNTKYTSFKTSVDSLIKAYKYKLLDEDINNVSPCDLEVDKCDIEGYLEKKEDENVYVYLTNGSYCAIGYSKTYQIKEGDCSSNNTNSVITDIVVTDITSSKATVLTSYTDSDIVTSVRFKLMSNNNIIVDYVEADTIDNKIDYKVAKKVFNNLEANTNYLVIVEVMNNSNNISTLDKTFKTLGVDIPLITYNNYWEKEKSVTITYSNISGVMNKYRVKTNNLFDLTGWQVYTNEPIIIKNYHYYVEAKSQIGTTNLTNSAHIGYVDNNDDINNTKPSIEVVEYKENNKTINKVNVIMSDSLSGVSEYCISDIEDIDNCTNNWIKVSNEPEIREKTVSKEINNSGTYYAFLKDYVSNYSEPYTFTVNKIHYELNGGNGSITDQIKFKNKSINLTDVIPTKDGYTFLGWGLSDDAHNVTYTSNQVYSANSDITLYAIYRKEVVITYNKNLGVGPDIESSSCYIYNNEENCSIKFRTNQLTRNGYNFKGYSTSNNGSISYNVNETRDIGNSMTVYAGWEAIDLTYNDEVITRPYSKDEIVISKFATGGDGNYTYTKVSETKNGVNTNNVTVDGGVLRVLGGTSVGTYNIVVTVSQPVSNNIDNLTSISKTANIVLTIEPVNLSGAVISDITPVNYNGTAHTPDITVTINNTTLVKNIDYTTEYTNNINAGNASVTITGIGGYIGTKSKTFRINRVNAVNTSVVGATLTYNTLNQSLITSVNVSNSHIYYSVGTIINSENYLSIGSETRPTRSEAGTYTIYYYAPSDNYNEVIGSVVSVINPITLNIPVSPAAKTYNGSNQLSGITCPTGSSASGTQSAITVGTYTQTCTLNSTNNYKWNDNTTTAKNISWTINRLNTATIGSCKTGLIYNGSSQTLVNAGNYVSYSPSTGINAGSYNVTVTANSNYAFSDGTTSKSLSCSIGKANPTMNLSSIEGTHKIGTNGSITISGTGYGTLTCSSSNTSIVTCSASGSTITIAPVSSGTATLSITGAGGTNYNPISKTYSATIEEDNVCPGSNCVYSIHLERNACWKESTYSSNCGGWPRRLQGYYNTYTENEIKNFKENVFLGYILDSTGLIQKAYACGKANNKIYCLEGALGIGYGGDADVERAIHERNFDIMNSVYGSSNCYYVNSGSGYWCGNSTDPFEMYISMIEHNNVVEVYDYHIPSYPVAERIKCNVLNIGYSGCQEF